MEDLTWDSRRVWVQPDDWPLEPLDASSTPLVGDGESDGSSEYSSDSNEVFLEDFHAQGPVSSNVDLEQLQDLQSSTPANGPRELPGDAGPTVPSSGTVKSHGPGPPVKGEIKLTTEQMAIFSKVKRGENVFFTGSAGTGKSVLLRQIIAWCSAAYGRENVGVTASTGIAALNIGGCTLHSWAGIDLGKDDIDVLISKIIYYDKRDRHRFLEMREKDKTYLPTSVPLRFARRSWCRWQSSKVLILDEISMIDGKLFDKLENIARQLRKNNSPFGGLQLVLCGDFLQLPPVPDSERGVTVPSTFAFEAESWSRCVPEPIYLRKVFRQTDQEFVDMLNLLRVGKVTSQIVSRFRELAQPRHYPDGLGPTELFPTKDQVDVANAEHLARLGPDHEGQVYQSVDAAGYDRINDKPYHSAIVKAALDRMMAPRSILLKRGAQVMLIKNLKQNCLVNGSLGIVVDFMGARDAYTQDIPFGLSRCLQDVCLLGTTARNRAPLEENCDPPDWLLSSDRLWPLIRSSWGRFLCVPVLFEAVSATGKIEATRHQIPLILSWAISIHKSQGQTLERTKVNLDRAFEKGQVYVALSRATSLDTLEVHGFQAAKVEAHPRVLEWLARSAHEEEQDDSVDNDLAFWEEELS